MSRDSSVGIATRTGLDSSGIECRWGARFSASVQTGPGAHPAPCAVGTGSFSGIKGLGRRADHPPHLSPKLKSIALPLHPLRVLMACSWVNFTFTLLTNQPTNHLRACPVSWLTAPLTAQYLEQPVPHIVTKFRSSYTTRRFIAVFTTGRHLSLPRAR